MTYSYGKEYRNFDSPLWEVSRVRKWWWLKQRYILRRKGTGWPHGMWQYFGEWTYHWTDKIEVFKTLEEAEAKKALINRTWPETFEYEVTVPLQICGPIVKTHDGIKHFYLYDPYRYWCNQNLGEHHGFYRYPREDGTNYIGVKNIVDVIALKSAIEYWLRGEQAP